MSKAKRGRSFKPIPKLDATPEESDRAIFAAVKPPDSSMRRPRFQRAIRPLSARAVPQQSN